MRGGEMLDMEASKRGAGRIFLIIRITAAAGPANTL
jgi:hypothetical protein